MCLCVQIQLLRSAGDESSLLSVTSALVHDDVFPGSVALWQERLGALADSHAQGAGTDGQAVVEELDRALAAVPEKVVAYIIDYCAIEVLT